MIDVALQLLLIRRMNVRNSPISKHVKDIRGNRYGRLTAIKYVGTDNRSVSVWECRCDCGKTLDVTAHSLKKGHTRSCGCLKKDKFLERITRHGHASNTSRSPEYSAWVNLVARCSRTSHPQYRSYGGRGIKVCERWLKFDNFFHDLGSRPSPNHSIHRIDNDRGYVEGNVKWATWDEQSNAKRTNHAITFNGKTMNLMQWAKEIGVHYVTLHYRLKRGWSIERALTTPLQRRNYV